jgi:hypothetical protein
MEFDHNMLAARSQWVEKSDITYVGDGKNLQRDGYGRYGKIRANDICGRIDWGLGSKKNLLMFIGQLDMTTLSGGWNWGYGF